MNRRGFLRGIIACAVAPAIIRTPGLIMPIKPLLRSHGTITFPSNPTIGDTISINGEEYVFEVHSLFCELTDVTRAAFVPKALVDLYFKNPVLAALEKPAA